MGKPTGGVGISVDPAHEARAKGPAQGAGTSLRVYNGLFRSARLAFHQPQGCRWPDWKMAEC